MWKFTLNLLTKIKISQSILLTEIESIYKIETLSVSNSLPTPFSTLYFSWRRVYLFCLYINNEIRRGISEVWLVN